MIRRCAGSSRGARTGSVTHRPSDPVAQQMQEVHPPAHDDGTRREASSRAGSRKGTRCGYAILYLPAERVTHVSWRAQPAAHDFLLRGTRKIMGSRACAGHASRREQCAPPESQCFGHQV